MMAAVSALPIEVEPTDPPTLAVLVLGQHVDVGPADRAMPIVFTVGIWPGGLLGALRGVPSMRPVAPTPPVGFSPLAFVLLERAQAVIQHRDIELVER